MEVFPNPHPTPLKVRNAAEMKGTRHGTLFLSWLLKTVFVALVPVLELGLVDQAGLGLTEIHLFLPPEC